MPSKPTRKRAILLPDSEVLELRAVLGVHPIALALIEKRPPEPRPRVRALAHGALERVFRTPRIGLVASRDGIGYWCITGIREYHLLVRCAYEGRLPFHLYTRIKDTDIEELARMVCTSDGTLARRL
jgi:hypothetical protein